MTQTPKMLRRPLTIELVGYGPLDGLWIKLGAKGLPPAWEILEPGEKPVSEKRLLTFRLTNRTNSGCVVYEWDPRA